MHVCAGHSKYWVGIAEWRSAIPTLGGSLSMSALGLIYLLLVYVSKRVSIKWTNQWVAGKAYFLQGNYYPVINRVNHLSAMLGGIEEEEEEEEEKEEKEEDKKVYINRHWKTYNGTTVTI